MHRLVMVIVVVIVSSSVLFCVVVDSFRFGAVWILSTRRLSVVRVVFHCCGFFPLQSRVDSFHSAAHRCPAVIVLSVSHYVAHWPCFIKGRAAGFWCGDSGVVHAGASQPGRRHRVSDNRRYRETQCRVLFAARTSQKNLSGSQILARGRSKQKQRRTASSW